MGGGDVYLPRRKEKEGVEEEKLESRLLFSSAQLRLPSSMPTFCQTGRCGRASRQAEGGGRVTTRTDKLTMKHTQRRTNAAVGCRCAHQCHACRGSSPHKSQQACRRWRGWHASIKGGGENTATKALLDANTPGPSPPGMRQSK